MQRKGAAELRAKMVHAVGVAPIAIATTILLLSLDIIPTPGSDRGVAIVIDLAAIGACMMLLYLVLLVVFRVFTRTTIAVLLGWVCMALIWAWHGLA